jgi:hypothetical protein
LPYWCVDRLNRAGDENRGGGDGKRRWKLDINARYTVVLGLDERNGVMEPKQLAGTDAPESAYELTSGRLKAGIEIGMSTRGADHRDDFAIL